MLSDRSKEEGVGVTERIIRPDGRMDANKASFSIPLDLLAVKRRR
jgi:hypothetical protein